MKEVLEDTLHSCNKISINFSFMGPCIFNVLKQDQQDATFHNDINYYK